MRRTFCAAILLVSLACIANSAPVSEADLKNLLAGIRQNRSTQADFQEQRMIRLMRKPIQSSGKVWFQPPNKFRREVKGSSPSLTVSDGHQLWIYYPNFKAAERYPLGKGSPLDSTVAAINSSLNLEDVENTFQITATKTDPPQAGYELTLLPRAASMKRVFQKLELRINDQLRVERTDMLLPNGDRIVTTYSNQARGPVPASMFEFTPPAGTDVSAPLGK
jgi:outer membrane lipoprotein-sorting protein